MKSVNYFVMIACTIFLLGCQTAEKVANEGGQIIGKTTNAVGGITEGGAEAVKGTEENPYGR